MAGPLTNGVEAVVVRPTLWVWNGGLSAFDAWAGEVTGSVSGFPVDQWELNQIDQIARHADLALIRYSGINLLRGNGDPGFIDPPPPCRPGSDRPIGLSLCGSGYTNEAMWCDLAIVVTREAIEKALASPYQAGGVAKGVVAVHLADFNDTTSSWNGNYDLYLRVDRIP